MKEEKIITDAELNEVWQNANFGNVSKRDVVRFALLKAACGYANGHTAQCIIQELGLVGKSEMKSLTLTKKGKQYLWEAFGEQSY